MEEMLLVNIDRATLYMQGSGTKTSLQKNRPENESTTSNAHTVHSKP